MRATRGAWRRRVEVEGEFDVIEGDEIPLRQAFSNLLRNAIEACAAAPVLRGSS